MRVKFVRGKDELRKIIGNLEIWEICDF
jgi:hypothetical protein